MPSPQPHFPYSVDDSLRCENECMSMGGSGLGSGRGDRDIRGETNGPPDIFK